MGLDWDAIRRENEAQLEAERLARIILGEEEPPPAPKQKKRPSRARPASAQKGKHINRRALKYDRDELLSLYNDGLGVVEIARQFGAHRSTIHHILAKELGITPRKGKPGPPLREKCGRGHDMKDAVIHKDGTRECIHCKRAKNRAYYQRKQAARQAEKETAA